MDAFDPTKLSDRELKAITAWLGARAGNGPEVQGLKMALGLPSIP
jgi:hypothetical protein